MDTDLEASDRDEAGGLPGVSGIPSDSLARLPTGCDSSARTVDPPTSGHGIFGGRSGTRAETLVPLGPVPGIALGRSSMREPIRSLMVEALAKLDADLPGSWDQVLLLKSTGTLVHIPDGEDAGSNDRGAHFVILSAEGAATHYCKCRRMGPDSTETREARILAILSRDPEASRFVPEFSETQGNGIQVQATRFVDAPRMDEVLPGLDAIAFKALVRNVHAAARCLSLSVRETEGKTREVLRLSEVAAPLLKVLPEIGIGRDTALLLHNALVGVDEVPFLPQHRDLWPSNIFVHSEGHCTIVDFDHFGLVGVPLHDALHLVRTSSEVAGRVEGRLWFEQIRSGDAAVVEIVGAIARDLELSVRQVGGCFLYYLLDMAVGTYLRGGPESFWGRFRDELPAVAGFLEGNQGIAAVGRLVSPPAVAEGT
jgi:hypothetical protein